MTASVEPPDAPSLFDAETSAYRGEVFAHLLEREVRRAMRYQEFPVVLAVALGDPHTTRIAPPLLRVAAEQVQGEVRTTDLVGRLGDGLGVALVSVTEEDARLVARRLLARVEGLTRFEALPQMGRAAVRIGGACFPRGGSDAQGLLQASLAALQRAADTPGGAVWIGG